jgi:WD40 repeat protein
MNTPIYYLEELSNIFNYWDNKFLWKQTQNLSGHEDVIYSMDLSPDGTRAVTGGGDM